MTKQEFDELQLKVAESEQPLKTILPMLGIAYSTYNYWRKKFTRTETPVEIAPIVVKSTPDNSPSPSMDMVELPGVYLKRAERRTRESGALRRSSHGSDSRCSGARARSAIHMPGNRDCFPSLTMNQLFRRHISRSLKKKRPTRNSVVASVRCES